MLNILHLASKRQVGGSSPSFICLFKEGRTPYQEHAGIRELFKRHLGRLANTICGPTKWCFNANGTSKAAAAADVACAANNVG